MEEYKREKWISRDGEVFYGTSAELIKKKQWTDLLSYVNDDSAVLDKEGWVHVYYDESSYCPLHVESLMIYSDAQIECLQPLFEEYENLMSMGTVADWDYTLFEKELEKENRETYMGE